MKNNQGMSLQARRIISGTIMLLILIFSGCLKVAEGKRPVATRSSEIPKDVLKYCLDFNGRIAEANEKWQETDVIKDHSLARNRLIGGCQVSKNEWQIVYEQGGRGHNFVNLRVLRIDGTWKVTEKRVTLDNPHLDCASSNEPK